MQHYGIPYHGKWHRRDKPTTDTSVLVRTALCKTKDQTAEMGKVIKRLQMMTSSEKEP